jgi:phosphonate transport system ATP-binding protein
VTPAVKIEGARVAAGARVLLELPRLVIETGEHVAIVGPNGAGKSTLLKLIGAVSFAQDGQVQVLGRPVGPDGAAAAGRRVTVAQRAWRRETGLLMQGLHLVPRLTARENVLIGALARLHGGDAWRSLLRWYPPALVEQADAALAALGLADRAATRADRLSGGERQKVALARVQLQRPRLLLADEPTSALDPAATAQVCHALQAWAAEPGRTLITVVHDLDLLPQLATRVIGMAAGRVQWDRPIGEVAAPMLQDLYSRCAGGAPVSREAGPAPIARLARA